MQVILARGKVGVHFRQIGAGGSNMALGERGKNQDYNVIKGCLVFKPLVKHGLALYIFIVLGVKVFPLEVYLLDDIVYIYNLRMYCNS